MMLKLQPNLRSYLFWFWFLLYRYRRNVDQSDPEIQRQMAQYVEDLAALPEIGAPPAFFWVRDFPLLAKSAEAEALGLDVLDVENLSFNEQIDLALSIPQVRQIYGLDIVRDEFGNITASRTALVLRNIDFEEVTNQIRMLQKQRDITMAQPANQGVADLSFFSMDDMYFFWELYDITVEQLIYSTITSVALVSFVAFMLIPHWSALLFVLPLMIMLYFYLLGT
jgi:Patched family